MAPKRILFYCGGSHVAGVEILTLSIMRELRSRGHEIHCLVSGWNDGDFVNRLEAEGIPYDSLKLGFLFVRRPLWTLDTLLHYPGAALRHWRIQRRFRPDIAWHVSYRTVLMLHPFQNPTRTVLHVHDCDRPGRATRFIYSLAALKVARFIAVSRFVGDHLAQIGVCRAKIEVILTGIEADFADPMSPAPTQPPNSSPRVGIVGQIIQRKGHEDLLEALGLLAERGVSFRCLVFGKGDASFQARLRHRASSLGLADRVEWRGFAPRQEIYRQLDLVAVPTRDVEPLGLVALEPAFWGLPVVASRVGGLPEAVADGVSGRLCAPADPADLADKLEPLLRDPQLRRTLGKGARRRALEKFTLDRMIGEIESLMDRL